MLEQADWTEENKVRALHDMHEAQVKEEQNQSTVKQGLLKLIDTFKEKAVSSKGFLTAEGRLINYHEWHAVAWGALLMILYFRLEQGLFLILFIMGIVKVWRDAVNHDSCTSKYYYFESEIGKNVHYYVASGVITAELFILTGSSPPSVNVGVIALMLQTFFGL